MAAGFFPGNVLRCTHLHVFFLFSSVIVFITRFSALCMSLMDGVGVFIMQRNFTRLAGPIDDWLSPMCNPLFSLAGRRPLGVHCSSSYSLYILLLYFHLLQLRASLQQRPILTSLSMSKFKKPEPQFGEYLECSANASFHIMAVTLRCNSL